MKKAAIAVLLAFSICLTACSGKESADAEIQLPIYGAEEIQYEIAEAKYMDLSETEGMGVSIGYPYAVYLTYPANAQVVSFNALKGRKVTEGEILAELDSSELDYDINNQQTIVNAAYQTSLSGSRSDQLQYEIEKMKLDMMLEEKDSYIIKAPFDGIITQTAAVSEGSSVKSGALCCAISEIEKVEIYLDGSGASQFRYGQEVQVKIDNDMYDAVVTEAPDIAPATAYGSSAGRAVFDLGDETMAEVVAEKQMAIAAGWATVYVTTERKNVLAVPDSAVKTTGTESYVTLLDGEERYKLKVTKGASLGGYTEIVNGISEGDVVIAEGSGLFTDIGSTGKTGGQNNAGDFGQNNDDQMEFPGNGEAPPERPDRNREGQ